MYKYFKSEKHAYFIGFVKRFQWFGIMFSTDNPTFGYDYFLFEFRFLWLRIWYSYTFETKRPRKT